VHINAFNFPVWGLLEKLGPSILAGAPVIAKPATATAYLAEAMVRMVIDSGILPRGRAADWSIGSTVTCSIASRSVTWSPSPARPTRRRSCACIRTWCARHAVQRRARFAERRHPRPLT
jgi:hypothetical protein